MPVRQALGGLLIGLVAVWTAPGAAGPVLSAADESAGQEPNVYADTVLPVLRRPLSGLPPRVYVPNSGEGTVSVVDPTTRSVVRRFAVGAVPHHVTPSWDLRRLYVNNTASNTLTVVDVRSGMPVQTLSVRDPYNLYFTPEGTRALVVAERDRRLDVYTPLSWRRVASVPVPWAGVDHLDFDAEGRMAVASAEFSGVVVQVDLARLQVSRVLVVGGQPVDVRLAPDGSAFYVANQGRHGVSVIDARRLLEVAFLPTGRGAHGLQVSRDARRLYVSNRLEGTITVVDPFARRVVGVWTVGGSPDMMQVSPDGRELWVSNRFHGTVSVVDTSSGHVLARIAVGAGPHGLAYVPQPGRYSLGHNGVYR
jgi:YVTN family beta-propeller protein